MSLVAYPDSDEDDGQDVQDEKDQHAQTPQPRSLKRRRDDASELPPLPAAFHDLYSTNARIGTRDDPALHGGRKRAVKHVDGNWPSHIYLEWVPSPIESQHLHALIESVQQAIERANKARAKPLPVPDVTASLRSPLGASLPLHISLSRTLQIKTEDRETFLETLTACLRKAAIRSFDIKFSTLKWVPNYERNRWFLVLSIAKPPHDELNKLLDACNEASEKRGHHGLYIGGQGDGPMEDASTKSKKKRRRSNTEVDDARERIDRSDRFHVSIAWNLIEPAPEWIALVSGINVAEVVKPPSAPFDVVKARIGNVVHNIRLGSGTSSVSQGAGMLGLG